MPRLCVCVCVCVRACVLACVRACVRHLCHETGKLTKHFAQQVVQYVLREVVIILEVNFLFLMGVICSSIEAVEAVTLIC